MEPAPKSAFDRFKSWVRNSISLRIVTIAILVLILLIPTSMIESLIREREYTRENVIDEVSGKWGREQTLVGPVLTIPYKSYTRNSDDKLVETTGYAHFLPEALEIYGELSPEVRYRSIYEAVVYGSSMMVRGVFPAPDFTELDVDPKYIQWEDASVSLGISDMRGIEEQVTLKWNTNSYDFNPGVESTDVISSGISTRVQVVPNDSAESYGFSLDLNLNGSKELNFTPVGKETQVSIRSPWTTPSFDGAFLPDERKVEAIGFAASWRVLHLNRNFPQQWTGSKFRLSEWTFGVNLLIPVDQYQKSMRSAKYAILFISLTFVVFFFIETLNAKRIHPIQYILVGLALSIFYVLLLSFSEHIGFNGAFLLASLAITALIGLYSLSVFQNRRLAALMALLLVIMYGFIYTILQLEDYALLMGSVGLFIVLGMVMYLSRKIDWYSYSRGEEE